MRIVGAKRHLKMSEDSQILVTKIQYLEFLPVVSYMPQESVFPKSVFEAQPTDEEDQGKEYT